MQGDQQLTVVSPAARIGRIGRHITLSHRQLAPAATPVPPVTPAAVAAAAPPGSSRRRVVDDGLLFRGTSTETRFAGFPSLVCFSDEHLGCAFAVAPSATHGDSARDQSMLKRTVWARSRDAGRTWELEGPVCATKHVGPRDVRVSLGADGHTVLGFGSLISKHVDDTTVDADALRVAGGGRHPMGYAPMSHVVVRSADEGHTWQAPTRIAQPMVGPCYELCCPPLDLGSRRVLVPLSTYPSYHGDHAADAERVQRRGNANPVETVAFVSSDGGHTFPEVVKTYSGEMEDRSSAESCIFWCEKLLSFLPLCLSRACLGKSSFNICICML